MAPRPYKWRFCRPFTGGEFFKPRGIPLSTLEIVDLGKDELEAMRLCDFEEKDQEQAAKAMNISRGTVQRLLYSGRKKTIDAILHSKAIKVVGREEILPPPIPIGPGPRKRMRRGRRCGWKHRGGV